MRTYITKAQALQLAGSWRNDILQARYHLEREGRASGEVFCTLSGAKIYMARRGCVWRYYLMGYASDGSDVQECLNLLKYQKTKYRLVRDDGESSKFFGEADFGASWPGSVAHQMGFKVPPGMRVRLERTTKTVDDNGKTIRLEVVNL